ncbi:MAG: DMT family transporter [Gammaproteobacteria bacterium]|nr:DMT family transporter [Gammaproteobacteria bacterium]MDX2460917.1 DMT family transporter [Gammaproteobacteria bacterium]
MSEAAMPLLLALAAACLFGVATVISKRALMTVDPQSASLVIIGTVVVLYLATSPLWMRAEDWFTPGFWIFVLNGFMHPFLSMYLALEATARTGPTVAATLSATAPLFASFTAVAFLGESINAWISVGTVATVMGVMTLSWSPRGAGALLRITLLFATGAAIVRGLNHTLGKFGLESMPNVFMAGFVSFTVSFCCALLVYRLRTGTLIVRLPRAGLGYLVATGAVIAVAIVCMYGGLVTGQVVVVSPIIAAYPLFTLLTALIFKQERLTTKLALGVLLVVGGVVLISRGSATA